MLRYLSPPSPSSSTPQESDFDPSNRPPSSASVFLSTSVRHRIDRSCPPPLLTSNPFLHPPSCYPKAHSNFNPRCDDYLHDQSVIVGQTLPVTYSQYLQISRSRWRVIVSAALVEVPFVRLRSVVGCATVHIYLSTSTKPARPQQVYH